MTTGIMIFARMSSTRLPGKVLMPIGNRPLLGHVIDRVRQTSRTSGILVATSTDSSDEPLVAYCIREDVEVCRGPLSDVAVRALKCACMYNWDAFARVCGDRPFVNPADIDAAIAYMERDPTEPDLISNLIGGPVAPGLTVEVIKTNALYRLVEKTIDPVDREHITRYFYANSQDFNLVSLRRPPVETEGLRFVVDTEVDLRRMQKVVARLSNPSRASVTEVVKVSREMEDN